MSEELKEFQNNIIPKGVNAENPLTINQFTRVVLLEKIEALKAIDNSMVNILQESPRDRKVISFEVVRKTWNETVWHKTIQSQIDKLVKFGKELD